jgi:hypothetical protein
MPLGVWGQNPTITIGYGDTFDPALPTTSNGANTNSTAHVDVTASDFAFKEQGIYKGAQNNYLMFVQNKGFLFNTQDLGTITSVAVTYSSGTSTAGKAGVYFGDSEQSTYTSTSNQTIKGQSQTDTWTNNTSGYGYFQFSTSNKNVQVTQIVITYNSGGSPSTYTVTYDANGATSGTVPEDNNEYENGDDVTVLGNSGNLVKEHNTFVGWNTQANGQGTNYTAGQTFPISSNTTLYAKWNVNTHVVTMPEDDTYGTYTMDATNPVVYGTTVTLTYEPAEGYSNYAATWSVNGVAISGDSFTMPDEDVTVTVSVAISTDVTDVLTYSLIGITGTSYQNWTGKTSNSDAVYAGQSSGGNNSIQLRATSPSGIVTTTTGGKVKKVIVVWNSNTANGRTIDIYGKSSAYSSSADLYNNSNQGTKLGSIVCGSSTELIVSGDYAFVGIRSNANSLNLDEIRITWEEVVLTPHDITINSMMNGAVEADMASATQGTTITLTATPDSDYYLYSINATPTDGLTLHTNGTFTFAMPDENVNVNATFNQVSPMTVTEALSASLPFDPFHYVCVTGVVTGFYGNNSDITTDTYHRYYIAVDDASEDQLLVYNGTGLNHAAFSDANDLRVGDQVVVWGDLIDYTSNGNTVREIAKGNYIMSLERPVIMEYYQYSINGVEGDLIEIASGTEITLPSTVETVPTGFSFAGWTTNANDVEHVLAAGSSYTINETVEFFAVFAKDLGSTAFSFVITPSDFNKTSYNANNGDHTSEATTTTGETMDVTWSSSNVMLSNDDKIQFRKDPKGSISAVNLGTITNVVIEETSTDVLSIDYNDGSFTIENNGSATGYATSVTVTFTTNVTGYYTRVYTQDITGYNNNKYGYTLIASPINGVNPANVAGMTDGNFDLYRFNESAELEWENWKQEGEHNHFNLERGKGYLYAHKTDVTLAFAGTPVQGTTFNVTLNKTTDAQYEGVNLVGNPFGQTAYIDRDFYVMNQAGSEFITSSGAIAPMQGIIVGAASHEETLTFTTEAPSNGGGSKVAINLTRNRGEVIDRAIVRFGEGSQLHKFQLRENSTKVYFTEGNQDFAVVRSQKAQGEMPVNFKAEENGTYTLSVNTEEMELNYLHLVDNMTGMDVDLLQTPSYTFDATTNDYASRFRLVFSANNVDGPSTGSEAFAFYSNGNWVVSNEGEATLQVIDVNGRIVSNETINGTVATSINATPGVYMLRLVNGNEVKTQKIVVK